MWINVRDRQPLIKGDYKVKYLSCDIPEIYDETTDYFDGIDWDVHGLRQFIVYWWEK